MSAETQAWMERAGEELAYLQRKIRCLTAFLGTPRFHRLPMQDQYLARLQHDHMVGYRDTLQVRLDRVAAKGE